MSSKFKYTNPKDLLQNDHVHYLREENKQKRFKNLQVQDVKFGIKMRSPPTRKTQSENNLRASDLSNIQKLIEIICKNQAVLIQTQKPFFKQLNRIQQQNSKQSVTQFQNLLIQTLQNIHETLIKNQQHPIQEQKKKINLKSQESNSNSLSFSFVEQLKEISENIFQTLVQSKSYLEQIKKTFQSFNGNSKKAIQIKEMLIEQKGKDTSSKDLNDQISSKKSRPSFKKSQKTKFQYQIYLSDADPKDEIIDFSLDHYEYLNYTIVRQFFVQVYERILSKGHYNYIKDTFSKQDAKNYCTKNILYNVKKVLQLRSIWNDKKYIKKEKVQYPEQNTQLTIQNINTLLKQITDANLRRYPQKMASGVSQRVLQVVPKTNLLQSDQYDFLFLNKINIIHNSKPNYFSQIMETINKMIQIPSQQVDPLVQSTYFDIFREVLNAMIVYSNSQVVKKQQIKRGFDKFITQQKKLIKKEDLYSEYVNKKIKGILIYKLKKELLGINYRETDKIRQKIEQIFNIIIDQDLRFYGLEQEIYGQINQNTYQYYLNDDQIKSKLKNLYVNSKISPHFKKFTKSQVKEGQMEINDSTILRILTKWTEQLQQKFKKPQDKILKRTDLFKNNQFGLTDIQEMEAEQNQLYNLITNVLKEKNKNSIQKFLQVVKQENNYHQQIFGKEAIKGKYTNDLLSNISLFGAKMQKFSGHYIINYLNFLMHQLTEVPSKILQNQVFKKKKKQEGKADYEQQINLRNDLYNEEAIKKIKNINLVTLKIGDLMRGKYSCSQVQFIRLINIMETVSRLNPNLMKIIRVKNRLESKDNDILINMLFMNKIQCEFQLSLSSDHSLQAIRQKKTNEFNHYLYEISRSLLGPISQLTGILIQEDPLTKDYFAKNLVNFNKICFFPINYEKERDKQKYQNNSSKTLTERENLELSNQNIKYCKKILPFECQNRNCRQIILLNNDINFEVQKKICLECSVKELLKKDKQNKKEKGFSLIKKFVKNETKHYISQQGKKQLAYDEYFQYFDHTNQETFQKVTTINDLLFTFPKVGCFINIKQKKPELKLFFTYKLNQQIFIFSPNLKSLQSQSSNKKDSLNFQKVKILGKFKFSDKQSIKSFAKTIPKTQVMWGFKNKVFEEDMISQLSFLNVLRANNKLDQFQLKIFQQNLIKTINFEFMQKLLLQRKSNVNINRFAKISNRMLDILFKKLKKDVSYIKEFRANKSIIYQDEVKDQCNTQSTQTTQRQIQSQNKIGQSEKRKPNNDQTSWLNGFLTLQKLEIKSNNMNKLSLEILLEAKSENLKKIKYLDISSNKIGILMSKVHFKNLIGLENLKCLDNGIIQIQSLQSLKQLKQVDFSKNQLSSCQFIQQNMSVSVLKLANNKIRQISCLKKLTKLIILNLKNNSIQDIQVCQNFIDLKNLNLEKNQRIRKLQYLKDLRQLEYLNIQDCCKASDISLEYCIKLKIINLGNTLITNSINNQIKNMKELKQISFFNCKELTLIQLIQQTKIKKIELKNTNLRKITIYKQQFLEELYLSKCSIQDQGIIQNCPNLKILDLGRVCQKKQFKLKIKNCKNIKMIDLRDTTIHPQKFEQILQQLSLLQNLSLSYCYNLQNIQLNNQKLKNIQILQLNGIKIKQFDLQELPQLQNLNLSYCRNLQKIKIKNCKNIKKLDLTQTKVNQFDLQQILQELLQLQQLILDSCLNLQKYQIKNGKSIKKLQLNRTKIKQSKLEQMLQQLQQLQQLNLNGCQSLQKIKIKNGKSIKILNLDRGAITECDLQELPQLQQISLGYCSNLQKIKIRNCKRIKKLNLNFTKVKQSDLQSTLQQLFQLQNLQLIDCKNLQNIKIKNCKGMKYLDLSATNLKQSELQLILQQLLQLQQLQLNSCMNLQKIDIKYCKNMKILRVGNTAIKQCYLQQLPQLQHLDLHGSYDSSKLQKIKIKNCKSIKKLDLNGTKIIQSDLEKILQQLSQLQRLDLEEYKSFQKAIIKNCKSIKILNLKGSTLKQCELLELPQLQQIILGHCSNLQKINIKNCKRIKKLDLNRTKVKQFNIEQILQQIPQLQQLQLNDCKSLQKINIKNCKKMETIFLGQSTIKQCYLQELPQLTRIDLGKCLSLQTIKIKNCRSIKRLDLDRTKVKQSDLEEILQQLLQLDQFYLIKCLNIQKIRIKGCKFIRILNLSETNIKQCHLEELSSLQQLYLTKCLNVQTIKTKNCNQIKILNLTRTKITQLDLQQILQQLSQLQDLCLSGCQNFQSFKIKKCQSIKKLQLNGTKIKQCDLQQLQNLQQLNFCYCQQLQSIKIKNCKIVKNLNLYSTKINQLNLNQILQELSQLQQLDLRECKNFQKIKIKNGKIKSLSLQSPIVKQISLQQLPQLQKLYLTKCSLLSVVKIKNCLNIKNLSLSGKVKQSNFQQIKKQLKFPQYLCLNDSQQIQSLNLRQFNFIREIHLNNSKIKTVILQQLPQLKLLDLWNSQHIQQVQIKQCKSIEQVRCTDSKMLENKQIIEYLQKQLPGKITK